MVESHRLRRVRHLEAVQAQRHAAVQAIARERVLRQALEELDPQPEDDHLDYEDLVQRLSEVLGEERRRLGEE